MSQHRFLDGSHYATNSAEQVVAWFERITGREPTAADIYFSHGLYVAEINYRSTDEKRVGLRARRRHR